MVIRSKVALSEYRGTLKPYRAMFKQIISIQHLGNTKLAEMFLAKGANVDARDKSGSTSLYIAVRNGK